MTTLPHLKTMAEELDAGTAQLFDVREPNEWDVGHLQTALLVPLSELKAGNKPPHDVNKKTYLHCRSGKRVQSARPLLESMGFVDVIDLREGYDALVDAGFERGR